jgi:hypothetical protein
MRKQEFNKANEEIEKQKREFEAKQAKAAAKDVDPARLVTLSELTQMSAHVSCGYMSCINVKLPLIMRMPITRSRIFPRFQPPHKKSDRIDTKQRGLFLMGWH